MSKGPGLSLENIALYAALNCSFRIVNAYHYQHDQVVTRIDVKIGNEQYNVGFVSGTPIPPTTGDKILPQDDLMTPKEGIISCLNLKVNRAEIVRALKELLADIESNDK